MGLESVAYRGRQRCAASLDRQNNRVGRTPRRKCWYRKRLSRLREIPLEITGRENAFGFRFLTPIALDGSVFLFKPIVFVL